jgi:uncharacterized protein
MTVLPPAPVVHVELHTLNRARACAFYAELFGWWPDAVHHGEESYLAMRTGQAIEVGIVEEDGDEPYWLPYVEVPGVAGSAERARELGGAVLLEPREGPAGWRAVIAGPDGGRVALWSPKT